jgi:N-hydroxyarylamine O-acetyltransferase
MSDRVNLKGYFDRIGFAGSIAPSLATLELLHALHPGTIPFENLNSLLGLPTPLDLPSIERKLLHERRGGYCYEHNLLFAAVLEELDYSVRRLSARVVWSDPPSIDEDAHHMLLAVDIGGATYIADVGNGGLSLTTPLRLRADVEQTTPHETYRLTGGQPEWQLEVKQADAWRPLYVFEPKAREDADFAASNVYLSTHPDAAFRRELRVALSPSGKRLVLRNNRLSTRVEGEPTNIRVLESVAEIREVLTTVFGIQSLPDASVLDPKLEAIIAAAPTAEE